MPISDEVWNELIEFIPGELKNRGPLAARWGEGVLGALVAAGHLIEDGGRLTRAKQSADAAELWDVLPEDGSTIGNQRARTELGWKSEKRYEAAKAVLLATDEIALGRGRGGSVRRRGVESSEVPAKPKPAERPKPATATPKKSKPTQCSAPVLVSIAAAHSVQEQESWSGRHPASRPRIVVVPAREDTAPRMP